MFKDYTNPLYEDIPDDMWNQGYCAIFAYALQERFGLKMVSMVVKSDDGEETMVHTVAALPDGRFVDADGIGVELKVEGLTDREHEDLAKCVFRPVYQTRVELEEVDLDRLHELTPEDVEATNAAHDYIDRHSEVFASLLHQDSPSPI